MKRQKKQTNQISELYNQVVDGELSVPENEDIDKILKLCKTNGVWVIRTDNNSHWAFVKSTYLSHPCIRMIFAIKEGKGGKVHTIERITDLIRDIESILIFVDNTNIIKSEGFVYLDIVKILRS